MNSYAYFDGVLLSELPLPELLPGHSSGAPAAIEIRLGGPGKSLRSDLLYQWIDPEGEVDLELRNTESHYQLTVPGIVSATMNFKASQLTVMPLCDDESLLREQLLDQLLPRVMSNYIPLVMHASCVTKAGKTLAFIGNSGAGKSTIAAYFQQAGWSVMTDDCLKVSVSDNRVSACGAYPGLKLLPDSNERLNSEGSSQTPIVQTFRKRRSLQSSTQPTERLLSAIVFLNPHAASFGLKEQRGADVLLEVIKQTFAFNPSDIEAASRRLQDGRRLLAGTLPCFSVSYPHDYEVLPVLAEALVERLR